MRQGWKCPVSLPFNFLLLESYFSQIGYTPRGLLGKAVESGVSGQVFESISGQDFFFFFFIIEIIAILEIHSYFFLHIERSFWCFADLVTIFERFREYSKIVPLMVSQSSLLFSWLNFCKLAHTSTTEKSLENVAVLLK